MKFSNLRIYRAKIEAEKLNDTDSFVNFRLTECPESELESYGWVNPLNLNTEHVAPHRIGKDCFFVAGREGKKLSAPEVKKQTDEYILSWESVIGRKLTKSERTEGKEDTVSMMTKNAYTSLSYTQAFYLADLGLLVIDASSDTKAEKFISLLRETLGGLSAEPVSTKDPIPEFLKRWVFGQTAPDDAELMDYVELSDGNKKAVFRNIDPESDAVAGIAGMNLSISKIGVLMEDKANFKLSDDFVFSSFKLDDVIITSREFETESAEHEADANAHMYAGALNEIIPEVAGWFGGLAE